MFTKQRAGIYKKITLALSLVAVLVWLLMGSGISIAWFSDTTPELKNTFHFAEFDLDVSYRHEGETEWKELTSETSAFDDEALYEPGYVQLVYFKVDNKGEVPFNFKTAVSVTDYTTATNVYGMTFLLQDYLRFGVVAAESEEALEQLITPRTNAVARANEPLSNYSTEEAELAPGASAYLALIVRMPEEVENVANYRGSVIPKVELGVIVSASQIINNG